MEWYFTTWNKVCDVVIGNGQRIGYSPLKRKSQKFWVSKVIADHKSGMF